MYSQVLTARWRDSPSTDLASGFDQQVRDEQSMDYFLAKYIWPQVNGALVQATSILEWGQELFYLGPGSWCHGTGPPDWGLVSNLREESGKFWNLLPGDTKLSAKWRPAMAFSENESEKYQWTLPLSQVSTYAAQSACRYGFLVTDQALVVLRFTQEHIGEGLAATRPSRAVVPQTHQRIASNETDVSSLLESMSLGSFGAQSYTDNDLVGAANAEFLPPEFAVIPMSAHGKGTLTVKFSIFCLCLMAGGGYGKVDYGYPPLDSWRHMDRHHYIHNTSALVAKRLPNNATLFDTEPQESQGPNQQESLDYWANQGDADVSGADTIDSGIHQAYYEGQPHAPQDNQGPSSPQTGSTARSTIVEVKKRDGKLCFRDVKGGLRKTKRKEWKQVSGGWVFRGEKHAYFTKHLPKD